MLSLTYTPLFKGITGGFGQLTHMAFRPNRGLSELEKSPVGPTSINDNKLTRGRKDRGNI